MANAPTLLFESLEHSIYKYHQIPVNVYTYNYTLYACNSTTSTAIIYIHDQRNPDKPSDIGGANLDFFSKLTSPRHHRWLLRVWMRNFIFASIQLRDVRAPLPQIALKRSEFSWWLQCLHAFKIKLAAFRTNNMQQSSAITETRVVVCHHFRFKAILLTGTLPIPHPCGCCVQLQLQQRSIRWIPLAWYHYQLPSLWIWISLSWRSTSA